MFYRIGSFISKTLSTIANTIHDEKICKFSTLSMYEQNDLLTEVFVQVWKSYWTANEKNTSLFKRNVSTSKENPHFLSLSISNKADGVAITLNFVFKSCTSFEVIPTISAPSKKLEDLYRRELNNELTSIKNMVSSHYEHKMFLRDFFDTLHQHEYSALTGREACWMYKIYTNAIKHYPDFKNMRLQKQIDILQKAFLIGRTEHKARRDIYTFARAAFYMLVEENAINTVIAENSLSHETTTYTKVGEHCKNSKNGVLTFVQYSYTVGNKQFSTSVHCTELWQLLCPSSSIAANIF